MNATGILQVISHAELMQICPRLACKIAWFCRQKYMKLAGKNTRIAGKNTRQSRQSQAKIPSRGQISFLIPFANVSVTPQYEKTSSWNLKHREKLIPITEATLAINTMKLKRSCSQFPSLKSEQYLSTRSKTCMHLKNFKFFLVFAGQKQFSGTRRATSEQMH